MPRTRWRLSLVLSLLAMGILACALGCGSGEDETDSRPAKAPAPKPVPEAPEPAPREPDPPTAPAALEAGDPQAGAAHYATFCASCHGDDGCGEGPLAETLDPRPAKHCDGNVMNPLEDAYLIQVISEGGPAVGKSPMMAPWGGSLDEQQILDVVAFIRSLADPPYTP